MKKIISDYIFDPANKKVILLNLTSIRLDGLLLITNVTDNVIIYSFADAAKGGTVSGNTLTLDYNTTTMSGEDSLQIFYDDGVYDTSFEQIGPLLEDLIDEVRKLRTVIELSGGISLS